MKKLIPLAATIASLALASSSAMAARTDYDVFIINGAQEVNVGQWDLVLDQESEIVDPDTDACRYFVKWDNYASLTSQARLQIDEFQTVGHEDCEENSYSVFHTYMQLAPGVNRGFDKFQQKKYVANLNLGQDGEDGELNGIIRFTGGAVYGFEAELQVP